MSSNRPRISCKVVTSHVTPPDPPLERRGPYPSLHPAGNHSSCDAAFARGKAEGRAEVLAELKDPIKVHIAMLRGDIATPSIRNLLHLHGEDTLRTWDEALRAQHTKKDGEHG